MARIIKLESGKRGKYLTVTETAEITGLEKQSVRDKLFRGQWTTYKFGHMTLLAVAEVERFLKNKGGAAKG